MGLREDSGIARLAGVLGRSVLVGALSGLLGGALIFFTFGFIGFSGASFGTRVGNGWDAVLNAGLGKGLVVGLGIAVGLALMIAAWSFLGLPIYPMRARSWLSALALLIVVVSNGESLRNTLGWDVAGLATVLGMALLVGAIVWAVSPWVLRSWTEGSLG